MAGTTLVSNIGFVGYETENGFAEDATTHAVVLQTRDERLELGGLSRDMVRRGGVYQRPNQMNNHIPGPFRTATFSFTMDLAGHGLTTAGSLTATALATLMNHACGVLITTPVGGTITGGTAGALTTSSGTFVGSTLWRVGAKGDGRGDGQGVFMSDGSGTLLTSMADAGNSGDALYAMLNLYAQDSNMKLTSDDSGNNNTLRFILASGNLQYALYGCACTGWSIAGLSTGEVPSITFTFQAAAWEEISVTFPSATAVTGTELAVPCANGSFFYNNVGTTTRQTDVIRNFSMSVEHQMLPTFGPGGTHDNQIITSWTRGKSMPTISFDVEAPAATAAPDWADWWREALTDVTPTRRHILYTCSDNDGASIALYFPAVIPAGPEPTQQDTDGLNYVPITCECVEGNSTATERDRAAWHIGLG